MQKIAIFSMGTRGDIQPYIVLSRGLINKGFDVTLGTHPCWRKLVESYGIHFVSIGPDVDIEKEAAKIRGTSKNLMVSMLKTMNFVFKLINSSSNEIYECCKGKDLIIISHSQMGATEAEYLKLKTINVTLQSEMLPETKKKKTLKDKVFAMVINPIMARPYNQIRKKYNLKKVKSMDKVMSKELNLIPISKYVLEPNPYWDEKNKVIGYWFLEEDDYTPSLELQQFLNQGEKPILLSLGAMSFESKEEVNKLNCFIEAFSKTNKRAIIQGFNKTLKLVTLPETMIAIDSVPHSWLFKQGYAVIHHCGFGTTASSMYYGIPSIPIPHVLDQISFANHLYRLNVGTKPIQASELSIERLIKTIQELDNNYEFYKDNVLKLAKDMYLEAGLERTIQLIEESINK
ncbi:MAG: glycosyltransferase [Anaerorhabdus sp.]|uniref:glycosyltransferase n=1 Tax=Anaerorhabdus sp. TaxID=1872524 RepID=UPI002FC7E62C